MKAVIDIVVRNVGNCLSWQMTDKLQSRSAHSSCAVGQPALVRILSFPWYNSTLNLLGKTRYGRELFDTLRRQLSEKAKAKDIDYSHHYYYMLLDFSGCFNLSPTDASLDAETILGCVWLIITSSTASTWKDLRTSAVKLSITIDSLRSPGFSA